ncbi:MAG: hypothetical protein AB7L92_05245 [Alphaproteobacteria bacterium]
MTDTHAIVPEKQPVAATPPDKPQTKELRAEVTFDKAVYGGISYGAQAGTGIILSHWLKYGGGLKYYDKMAEWTGKHVIPLVSNKRGAEAIVAAKAPVIVTTMIMVGNSFIPPVKWIEAHKPGIVRWLNDRNNKKLARKGYVLTDEERTAQEARLQQLEEEPPQNWRSLMGGRVFGLAAVYATLFGLNRTPKINNESMEKAFSKSLSKISEGLGMKKLAESKTFNTYTGIAFYDIFYSMISAGGLYVYSHFIEPPKDYENPNPKRNRHKANDAAFVEQAIAPEASHRIHAHEALKQKKQGISDTSYAERITAESADPEMRHGL